METLTVIVMLVLFLLALVFVFSIALLTPEIGKKNLLFVIFIGFVIGVIGGVFFVAPVLDDIPNIAKSAYQLTGNGQEVVELNISTKTNITNFIQNTKQIQGVKDVQNGAITIKTAEMSPTWQQTFQSRIPALNSNITSLQIPSNTTMILQVKNGTDPEYVINQIDSWMMLVSGLDLGYSSVHVSVTTDISNVDSVVGNLSQQDGVVITNVSGPVEEHVNSLKSALPNKSNVVLVCGILGVLTGLVGIFIDSILEVLGRVKRKIRK